jgi:mRNA interferase MazF
MYHQLDIWWVDLNPTIGAETRKKRPCVILQANRVNKKSRTLIVAPLLPDHKSWPFAVNLKASSVNGLDKDRHINVKQLRVVDTARLSNKQGELESFYLPSIHACLKIIFDM